MKRCGILIFCAIQGIICVLGIHASCRAGISAGEKRYLEKTDSAEMIINKYIDAVGGKEKLESIKTIYMEGSILARGQKIISKTWIINNKESRNESTNSGFTNWSIVHTDSAWSFNPRRGQKLPEPWPRDRVKIAQASLDIAGSLVDYKSKGYNVEYKGIEQIEGSDTYKIEEKLSESITKTFFIDLDSYLIIRIRSKFTTPNRVNYSNTDYSNYQKTKDGYVFPMQTGDLKYTKIEVNADIDDNLFMPKK